MRRNVWTVLTVFVCIFALAWVLNWARAKGPDARTALASSYSAQTPGASSVEAEPASAHTGEVGPGPDTPSRLANSETLPSSATNGGADTQGGNSEQQRLTPPVADTIARNPPNGMLFAGEGKFQLYRQGDITWRLDTDTGQACILFATEEQWAQQRVFGHGCAAR